MKMSAATMATTIKTIIITIVVVITAVNNDKLYHKLSNLGLLLQDIFIGCLLL